MADARSKAGRSSSIEERTSWSALVNCSVHFDALKETADAALRPSMEPSAYAEVQTEPAELHTAFLNDAVRDEADRWITSYSDIRRRWSLRS